MRVRVAWIQVDRAPKLGERAVVLAEVHDS